MPLACYAAHLCVYVRGKGIGRLWLGREPGPTLPHPSYTCEARPSKDHRRNNLCGGYPARSHTHDILVTHRVQTRTCQCHAILVHPVQPGCRCLVGRTIALSVWLLPCPVWVLRGKLSLATAGPSRAAERRSARRGCPRTTRGRYGSTAQHSREPSPLHAVKAVETTEARRSTQRGR